MNLAHPCFRCECLQILCTVQPFSSSHKTFNEDITQNLFERYVAQTSFNCEPQKIPFYKINK